MRVTTTWLKHMRYSGNYHMCSECNGMKYYQSKRGKIHAVAAPEMYEENPHA
jgi:hypothetical protein